MKKVRIIFEKEWLDVRLQRALLLSTFLVPPVATLLALGAFVLAAVVPGNLPTSIPPGVLLDPSFAGMSSEDVAQALIGRQFSIMFMLLPVFIPSVIASYAIVGEKRDRTLEPVLATPVRTWELLMGKSLAALVPTLAVSTVCAILFAIGVEVLARSSAVAAAVITPGWISVLVLDAPLLALIGIGLIVVVSSRVNDPRTAQQISAVLIVPILLLVFGNISGVVVLSPVIGIAGALALAVIALITFNVASRLFQREAILVRWR